MLRFFEIGWRTKTDGPGNRVIIYFQGCHLRCPWCHSPHSWNRRRAPLLFNSIHCTSCGLCASVCSRGVHIFKDGIHIVNREKCIGCGCCQRICPNSQPDFLGGALSLPTREMTPEELFDLVLPQAAMYRKWGGITLSGGEALLQSEELLNFLVLCRQHGISTCVESSFTLPNEVYQLTAEYVDYWLAGIRDTSFGQEMSNADELIKKNLQTVLPKAILVTARYPFINGFTTEEGDWERFAALMKRMGLKKVQILPCNPDTVHYYRLSGIAYHFEPETIIPTTQQLRNVCSFFTKQGFETEQM